MKVVFDTNILISALVFPGGRGEAALQCIIEERDELVVSKPLIDELLAVLARKFAYEAEELAHVAVFISELGDMVYPRMRLKVVTDEPDNRILECAIAGGADVLVTGDRELLRLGECQGIQIVALKDYLDSR